MGKIVHFSEEHLTLPNGRQVTFEFVHHPGGSAVVALDGKRQVCLLRHYRPVADGWLWEIPAGKRDDEEEPLLTAQRELREEAGMLAGEWQSLGAVYSSPGVFTEVIHLYLATELTDVGNQPEDDELFEVHWLPLEKAVEMATGGEINDAKTIIALLRAAARPRRG
jgi:8-oxo-dGTP pyrophosphatase MutT (NUDIX family)